MKFFIAMWNWIMSLTFKFLQSLLQQQLTVLHNVLSSRKMEIAGLQVVANHPMLACAMACLLI
eukprot:4055246-Prorocentrum_lima.AAC.1